MGLTAAHCTKPGIGGAYGLMNAIAEQVNGNPMGSEKHLKDSSNSYHSKSSYPYRFDYSKPLRSGYRSGYFLGDDYTFLKAGARLPDREMDSLQFMRLDTTTPPFDLNGTRMFFAIRNGFYHTEDPIIGSIEYYAANYKNGNYRISPSIEITSGNAMLFNGMSGTPYFRRNASKDNRWEIMAVHKSGGLSGNLLWVARDEMREDWADANHRELEYRRRAVTDLDTGLASYAKLRGAVDESDLAQVIALIDAGVDTTRNTGDILGRGIGVYLAAKAAHDAADEPTEKQKKLVADSLAIVRQLTLSGIDISQVALAEESDDSEAAATLPALHKAVAVNDWQLVETLLDNVTDYGFETAALSKGDSEGNTPAHYVMQTDTDRNIANHILGHAKDDLMGLKNDAGQTVTTALLANPDQEYADDLLANIVKRRFVIAERSFRSWEGTGVAYVCHDVEVDGKTTSVVEEAIKQKNGWLADTFDVLTDSTYMGVSTRLNDQATLKTLWFRTAYRENPACSGVMERVK